MLMVNRQFDLIHYAGHGVADPTGQTGWVFASDCVLFYSWADVMSYDASSQRLWFVTGGKNATAKQATTIVSQVDVNSGKTVGEITFDTDFTEGIVAEQAGPRLFVNVAGKSEIAVLDKKTRRLLATWPGLEGQNNSQIEVLERETGKKLSSFGRVGRYPGEFDQAHGIAVDSKSNVYIAENRGRKIQRFKPVTQ